MWNEKNWWINDFHSSSHKIENIFFTLKNLPDLRGIFSTKCRKISHLFTNFSFHTELVPSPILKNCFFCLNWMTLNNFFICLCLVILHSLSKKVWHTIKYQMIFFLNILCAYIFWLGFICRDFNGRNFVYGNFNKKITFSVRFLHILSKRKLLNFKSIFRNGSLFWTLPQKIIVLKILISPPWIRTFG